MVTGAAGSLIVNICTKGDWPVSLQWFGAALLYTALLFRNKQQQEDLNHGRRKKEKETAM